MHNFTWGIKNNFSLHSILFCSTSGLSNWLVSFGMFGRTVLADTCPGSMPLPIKPKCVMHSSQQFWSANYNKRRQITQLRNQLLQFSYSRLWNKHKGIFINFWKKKYGKKIEEWPQCLDWCGGRLHLFKGVSLFQNIE